jgi:dihydrodipicolinate synthase/N-acetylneuraminate lyase
MPAKVPWLRGVFPALVTLFAKDEEFDEKAYRNLIRHVLPHVDSHTYFFHPSDKGVYQHFYDVYKAMDAAIRGASEGP